MRDCFLRLSAILATVAPLAPAQSAIATNTTVATNSCGVVHCTIYGAMGNDRPFQVTSENWYSEDLHLMVLTKSVDPRHGESTFKLININRAEPPVTLFAPPSDYTVVDETGPFEIQWTGTRKQ